MKLKPDEFKAKLDEVIQNTSDPAKVTTILSSIIDDYNEGYAEAEKIKADMQKVSDENINLVKANSALFLKIGATTTATTTTTQPADNSPKFEDLFDADGNLK